MPAFSPRLLALAGCHRSATERDPTVLVHLAEVETKGLTPQAISDLAGLRIEADQFEGLTRFTAEATLFARLQAPGTAAPNRGGSLPSHLRRRRGLDASDVTSEMPPAAYARASTVAGSLELGHFISDTSDDGFERCAEMADTGIATRQHVIHQFSRGDVR